MITCSGLVGVMKKGFKNEDQSSEAPIVVSDSTLEAEGIKVQSLKEYGCGADVHRDFIQVSVIVLRDNIYYEYKHEFLTTWDDICKAKEWIVSIIESKSNPLVKVGSPNPFHYCLESTAQYHMVVLKAWLGEPELINPLLAGATMKKTDVADATKLSKMDLTGVWRTFYVPSDVVSTLRVLLAQRAHYGKLSTQISNRINSMLLRFGITIGREGSVTKSSAIREIIEEELISDSFDAEKIDISLCPDGLPDDVKALIQEEYEAYDQAISMRDEYTKKSLEKVRSMSWETRSDVMSGERMLSTLSTVPGIGDMTASIWLANIITP